MDNNWRLAFMLDAPEADLDGLEHALTGAGHTIRRLAGDAHVRMGVAERHPDLEALQSRGETRYRSVDGAVEVTVGPARAGEVAEIAAAMREVVTGLAAPSSIELTAGPVFAMVPPRDGETFLCLAFRRDPATTSQAFRDWWRLQHGPLCIPLLGEALLAYDQIHVDPAATQAVCRAFGAPATSYDAYDNLTWADLKSFFQSTSDPEGMRRVVEDEQGRIDETSRRNHLMRRVG